MEVEIVQVASGVWHARAQHVGWMLVADGDEVTLVDTGYPGYRAALLASLERIGRFPADVAAVLLTHAHPDHLGSAEHLRAAHGLPVWVHEQEAAHARGELIEQVTLPTLLRMAWRSDVRAWMSDIVRLDATKAERLAAVETFDDQPLDVPGRPHPVHTGAHPRPQRTALPGPRCPARRRRDDDRPPDVETHGAAAGAGLLRRRPPAGPGLPPPHRAARGRRRRGRPRSTIPRHTPTGRRPCTRVMPEQGIARPPR